MLLEPRFFFFDLKDLLVEPIVLTLQSLDIPLLELDGNVELLESPCHFNFRIGLIDLIIKMKGKRVVQAVGVDFGNDQLDEVLQLFALDFLLQLGDVVEEANVLILFPRDDHEGEGELDDAESNKLVVLRMQQHV